jgi:hypothetical protein
MCPVSFKVRAGHFAVALFAALALVIGSTMLHGWPFWAFSAAIIIAAGWSIWVLYLRTSRTWLLDSYKLLGEGRLSELKPRVEEELQRKASGVDRSVLEQLRAETLFWAGDFDAAYAAACAIDTSRMPELWRGATFGLRITSSLMGGHAPRAKELLEQHRAVLEKRPGLHHLEAMVALESGDASSAKAVFQGRVENWERPKLVRAALALIEARIALALGEPAKDKLDLAQQLGGESWVPKAARALLTS